MKRTAKRTAHETRATIMKWVLLAVTTIAALYTITLVYLAGHPLIGTMLLTFYAIAAYIYGSRRATTYRYLFPGLAGIAIFVVFPLVFTVWIGLTNYGSRNLLTFERATAVLLDQTFERGDDTYDVELHPDGDAVRLLLLPEGTTLDDAGGGSGSIFDEGGSIFDEPAAAPDSGSGAKADADASAGPARVPMITPPLRWSGDGQLEVDAVSLSESGFTPDQALPYRAFLEREAMLGSLRVRLPSGVTVAKTKLSMRVFSAEEPLYTRNPDGTLRNNQDGSLLAPDMDDGFYKTQDGTAVTPGFRVFVGFAHYVRLLTDSDFQEPFLRILWWTIVFSVLTVVFSLIVGVLLAELLDWDGLRFRNAYRLLLFIPYAVPSFISILVFKGLFNQNFGEINAFLYMLFGIKPNWITDPFLAKVMILIVNTWLGYPYIMLLWSGLKQSVPRDLYEASALAGSGPLHNFFAITWPLVRRPLMPLLVSSFAFNFNNFVLIKLLTDGRPDFLDTSVAAGTTDILVSYTFRIAFQATDKNYGLASAIATIIFAMVAVIAIINLRLMKIEQDIH